MPTLKSSLTYTMERDTRDDAFMTTSGSHSRLVLEGAGFGGDTAFVKAEGYLQRARQFAEGWSLSTGMRAGWMHTLDGRAACLSDRFMLGGPTDVRMFRLNSLGPRHKNDSLGGTAYWAAGASLLAPLPGNTDWPLKLHTFLNAGQLAQAAPTAGLAPASYRELLEPSASAGIGVLFQQGPVRLELNFGLPLLARRFDGARKGLQFGIGLEFL